jgi:hypothetical protein
MAITTTWRAIWPVPATGGVTGAFGAQASSSSPMLSGPEAKLVEAVADAFFPPAGPIPLSGCEAGVGPYFDRYLRRAQITPRVMMRLLLVFTELSPLVFGPRRKRFTRLRQDERLRFLDEARSSRIYLRRVAFISLRALMTMAYLSNDEVAERMGMVANTDPFGLRDSSRAEPAQEEVAQ